MPRSLPCRYGLFQQTANYIRACPQLGQPRCCLAGVGSYLNRKGNGSESYGEHRFLVRVRCDLGFTNHQLSDSWEVGLRRADRWSALAYATTNGIGSRIFCRVAKAMSEARRRITGCSLKPFCTGSEPVFRGAICRRLRLLEERASAFRSLGEEWGF